MYGCLSGIILVNAACTRSWLAIAPNRIVISTNRISSGLRWWKIQYAILPTQSALNTCFSIAASSAFAPSFVSFAMFFVLP